MRRSRRTFQRNLNWWPFGCAQSALAICALMSVAAPQRLASQDECPSAEGGGSLMGIVWDESRSLGLPGVRVMVRWAGGVAEVKSGPDGRYTVCSLPTEEPLVALAGFAGRSSRAHQFSVAAREVHEHEFVVSMRDATPGSQETGRIVGSVLDAATGQPVEAAVVGVAGRAYESLTNSEGRFTLDNVLKGPQLLELRHLAYGTQHATVDVPAGLSVFVVVEVAAQPLRVEPLNVTITGLRDLGLEIRGFYERQQWSERLGLGRFFTVEDIDRRRPRLISQMIADLPSTRLDCSSSPRVRSCELSFVGIPRTSGCQRADVYIDGVNVIRSDRRAAHTLDELVLPVEIAGVEVYPGPASTPAEFTGASGSCGVIVIWTK